MLSSESNTIITGISFEEYWDTYAEQGYEWIGEGMLKMPPVHKRHQRLVHYFMLLFYAYLDYRPIGEIQTEKFAMRFEYEGKMRVREPDLMIVLNESLPRLHDTYLDGPADIVIELVSPATASNDYGDKFMEYEVIGVQEYWILDPRLKKADFLVLQANGRYSRIDLPEDDIYQTPLLPYLQIHVPTLWKDGFLGYEEIRNAVRRMLNIND